MKKVLLIFLFFLCLNTFAQTTISGKYCTKNKGRISKFNTKNCLKFNDDLTFEETLFFDVRIVSNGKYKIEDKKLTLQYKDEKNTEVVFDIIVNDSEKLILKPNCTDCKRKKITMFKI